MQSLAHVATSVALSTSRSSNRSRSIRAGRAPALRAPRLCVSASATAGSADTAKALQTLRKAAKEKSVSPDEVVAAISVVEASPSPPTKAQLNGSWDLVFSSASKIKQFQYIPIDEKLVQELGKSEKNIMLRGDISPLLVNEITGNAEMKDGGVVAFQWKQIEIKLLGGLFAFTRPLTSGPKTYSYFFADDEIACARSSIGGVSLLRRTGRK